MGRPPRIAAGGLAYHVLNRANRRARLFTTPQDYQAFERVLTESLVRIDVRLLAYCVMPNHWHLVLWPRRDGDLSEFVQWLTLTHTQRWHATHDSVGLGHVYQGRFKSFPVQDDRHFLTVCRYIERNPVRSKLAARAENWQWGSLWRRVLGDLDARAILSAWPVNCPRNWLQRVNSPLTAAELEALRVSVKRNRPFGEDRWQQRAARRLGLESSLRPIGRPRKKGV